MTGPEIAALAATIFETPTYTASLVADLDEDVEDFILTRLTAYGLVRDSHVKLEGGRDGINFDNERKRAAIRIEIRILLGLSPVSDAMLALDPNAMSIFELEVGSNFA